MNIIIPVVRSATIFLREKESAEAMCFDGDSVVKIAEPSQDIWIHVSNMQKARILAAVINNDLESIPGILEEVEK